MCPCPRPLQLLMLAAVVSGAGKPPGLLAPPLAAVACQTRPASSATPASPLGAQSDDGRNGVDGAAAGARKATRILRSRDSTCMRGHVSDFGKLPGGSPDEHNVESGAHAKSLSSRVLLQANSSSCLASQNAPETRNASKPKARGRPRKSAQSLQASSSAGSVQVKRKIFDSELCRHEGLQALLVRLHEITPLRLLNPLSPNHRPLAPASRSGPHGVRPGARGARTRSSPWCAILAA